MSYDTETPESRSFRREIGNSRFESPSVTRSPRTNPTNWASIAKIKMADELTDEASLNEFTLNQTKQFVNVTVISETTQNASIRLPSDF